MKNTFMLGAISGITALAIGVPVLAQISSAQVATTDSGTSASAASPWKFVRPSLTAADIQDLIKGDQTLLDNLDEVMSTTKAATQAHKDALTAAAGLSDETARQDAVKAANDARRESLKALVTAHPDLKGLMPFGGGGRGHGGMMGMGRGPAPEKIAETLGLTVDEFKTEIASGKTIEQIATEKGVTLPAPPMGGHGRGPGMLAEKLGMTPDELKTALDSGKTIEQIAAEKGVTLPARPAGMGMGGMMGGDQDQDGQ